VATEQDGIAPIRAGIFNNSTGIHCVIRPPKRGMVPRGMEGNVKARKVNIDNAFAGADDHPIFDNTVRVHIEGMQQVGEGIFDILGVQVREIDWEMVAKGLGREFVPDALADRIDRACFEYSIAEVISERVTRR